MINWTPISVKPKRLANENEIVLLLDFGRLDIYDGCITKNMEIEFLNEPLNNFGGYLRIGTMTHYAYLNLPNV